MIWVVPGSIGEGRVRKGRSARNCNNLEQKNPLTLGGWSAKLSVHTKSASNSQMKTKALILAGLVSLAGVVASQAQTVYSVNIVGYVNLTIQPGFSMISNPLQGQSTSIPTLIPAPPEGTSVFKFNPATGGYSVAQFVDGAWEGSAVTLAPGEGVFIRNSSASAFTLTFTGEVVQSSSVALPQGFSIASSVLPQSGSLSSQLQFPVTEGDAVYFYNPNTGGYSIFNYIDGAWEPTEPVAQAGQAFFLRKSAARNWVRNFTSGT